MEPTEDMRFKDGDRVWVYGFGWKKHYGHIYQNDDGPTDWYIRYDDGEEFAVVNPDTVHKVRRVCGNCRHRGSQFKILKTNHYHCGLLIGEAKSPWDSLVEFYQTCNRHEFKKEKERENNSCN